MKKTLITLGAISTVAISTAFAVSCDQKNSPVKIQQREGFYLESKDYSGLF